MIAQFCAHDCHQFLMIQSNPEKKCQGLNWPAQDAQHPAYYNRNIEPPVMPELPLNYCLQAYKHVRRCQSRAKCKFAGSGLRASSLKSWHDSDRKTAVWQTQAILQLTTRRAHRPPPRHPCPLHPCHHRRRNHPHHSHHHPCHLRHHHHHRKPWRTPQQPRAPPPSPGMCVCVCVFVCVCVCVFMSVGLYCQIERSGEELKSMRATTQYRLCHDARIAEFCACVFSKPIITCTSC